MFFPLQCLCSGSLDSQTFKSGCSRTMPQFLPSLFLFISLQWLCHNHLIWAHLVKISNIVHTEKANGCGSILVLLPPPSGSLPLPFFFGFHDWSSSWFSSSLPDSLSAPSSVVAFLITWSKAPLLFSVFSKPHRCSLSLNTFSLSVTPECMFVTQGSDF